jgi:hypothetical protein
MIYSVITSKLVDLMLLMLLVLIELSLHLRKLVHGLTFFIRVNVMSHIDVVKKSSTVECLENPACND